MTAVGVPILQGTVIEPSQYIALVGFEDLEDTLYVGTFGDKKQASEAADKASREVDACVQSSLSAYSIPVPAVIPVANYLDLIKDRL